MKPLNRGWALDNATCQLMYAGPIYEKGCIYKFEKRVTTTILNSEAFDLPGVGQFDRVIQRP